MATKPENKRAGLAAQLTPLGAWALAFGSAVGWGCFVMPGTTFLPLAGPVGTVAGIAVGMLVMLLLGVNYHYLMNIHPDAGGAFSYAKRSFGYDHGFLCAWFLVLTYTAIAWANATALPLIARNLLGGLFQFGFHYQIAGFQVYLGEILLAVCAVVLAGLVCMSGKAAYWLQTLMALLLLGGIVIVFAGVAITHGEGFARFTVTELPRGTAVLGTLNIIALAPWAFVGFESISHSAGEFKFEAKKSLRIMFAALIAAGLAYALMALTAALIQPDGFANWYSYISSIGSLNGLAGLPTFFAASHALGGAGSLLIALAALGGIVTGLVGNFIAASRLIYSMAEDELIPGWFGKLNFARVPQNALLFLMLSACVMPFFGRTAIGWIVDVTTVGAAIAYAYVSACAFKTARREKNGAMVGFGAVGIGVSVLFILFFLLPNLLSVSTLGVESYFILAAWSILGFACFYAVFLNDRQHRMGRSVVMWIVLLSLILFTSLVWVRQAASSVTDTAAVEMKEQHLELSKSLHPETAEHDEPLMDQRIDAEMAKIRTMLNINSMVQMALIVLALFFLFRIYSIIQKRERQMEVDKILAEESNRAKTSFLSNMSHEIRTPMNAIIGLDNIALKDPTLSPRTREQLEKIGASAKHLLGLINDILDMSRIESGRMVLKSEEFPLRDFLDQINVMIDGQCLDKGLQYECKIIGQTDDFYVGDDMKLKQVLINILGNSVKFTKAPGNVTLTVEQTARFEGYCALRFTISDTGIGMDKAFLPRLFEAFSQEDLTATNIYGGSGLGMAITKNIVQMMNGDIQVESEKGKGSTFTVTVTLKASSRSASRENRSALPENLTALVVDDDDVALEHAEMVLSDIGIRSTCFKRSREALEEARKRFEAGEPFDLVLTDLRMPEMDGLEVTRAVRAFDGGKSAILMLTGYNYDDVTEQAFAAGADSLMSKPLFTDSLLREVRSVLQRKAYKLPELEEEDSGEEPVFALEGKRVLLAEDMEINADILIDLLDMEGVECEHAMNGQIAVDMFAQHVKGYYDAILMDVRMPVMDGLAATRAIRELRHPDARTIPIIALTANAFDEDVQRSLQAGMNAHLNKPVEMDRLYETLSKLTQKKKS